MTEGEKSIPHALHGLLLISQLLVWKCLGIKGLQAQ